MFFNDLKPSCVSGLLSITYEIGKNQREDYQKAPIGDHLFFVFIFKCFRHFKFKNKF